MSVVIPFKPRPEPPCEFDRCNKELRDALTPLALEYGVHTVITVAHEIICEAIEYIRANRHEEEWLEDLRARFERALHADTERRS
jgi:hypothetical protein